MRKGIVRTSVDYIDTEQDIMRVLRRMHPGINFNKLEDISRCIDQEIYKMKEHTFCTVNEDMSIIEHRLFFDVHSDISADLLKLYLEEIESDNERLKKDVIIAQKQLSFSQQHIDLMKKSIREKNDSLWTRIKNVFKVQYHG